MFSSMKIIDKMEPVVNARQNFDIITKECQFFLQTLQNFKNTLDELLDLPATKIHTPKNSSLNMLIKEHLNSLNLFNQAFHNFSISLQEDATKFEGNFQIRQLQRENVNNEIKLLNDTLLKLIGDKNYEGNIIKQREQLVNSMYALRKISKSKDKDKATEELKIAYPKYLSELNSYKSKHVKIQKMLDKLLALIKNYFDLMGITDSSFRTQLVSDGLRSISIHLNDFGNNLEKSILKLQTQKLDHNRDFTLLMTKKGNIEFHDFDITPFNKFAPIGNGQFDIPKSTTVTIYPYNYLNVYRYPPECIARLKAKFEGENPNELSCRKGQKVGVLVEKEPVPGWTLCINLFELEKVGYVPTDYLVKVGQGVAVVKQDADVDDDFNGCSGSLLCFIKKDGADKMICEDYLGKQASIPISNLIILPPNPKYIKLQSEEHAESNLSLKSSLTFDASLYKNIDDFEEVCKIGSGTYSEVKKYRSKKTGEFYAFKILELFVKSDSAEAQRAYLELRREIVIASLFNEPTLHSLYGIIDNMKNSQFIIITPYYKEGDLASMIRKEKLRNAPTGWDFTQKLIVMYGIASGMYILHQQNLIHRDLKPGNVLLTDDLEPMITDFGLSKLVDQSNSMNQTQAAGTPVFAAPEIYQHQDDNDIQYDGKMADVYAFAVLCYQMFTLTTPFEDIRSQYELVDFIVHNGRPKIPNNFNKPLRELIETCWNQEPEKRLSFDLILEKISSHEFISRVGQVDINRFREYQNKVAPETKFSTMDIIEEEEEDTDELEVIKEMPIHFSVPPSLIKDVIDYRKIEPIGKGRFGLVFKCQDIETKEFVAVKRIGTKFNEIQLQREIWILSTFNHQTLQSLQGVIQDECNDSFMIVTTFYPKGDLQSMINLENNKRSPVGWDQTQKFIAIYGIAAGMYFLHKYNIIHRDLKPDNILLNDNLEPIITDFGLSKLIDQNNTLFQSAAFGTPVYMAPEIVLAKTENGGISYDGKKADVYAFALICYQLYTGIPPFKSATNQYQLGRILFKGERPSIPENFNESIRSLIECCWDQSPLERPPFETIIEQLGNPEFIEGVGGIDLERFGAYQRRVVARKFRTINTTKPTHNNNANEAKRINTWRRPLHVIIKEMADAGDKESQYNYACMLRDGKGVEANKEQAVAYLKKSADLGYIDAIISYAKMLKEGDSVQKDEKEAFRIMESAAKKGDSEAQYNIGLWYANSIPPQYAIASVWLKKAANNSHPDPEAPATYASLLEKGKLGIIPPLNVITEYYKKSSDLGSPRGMYHMALLYHSGENPEHQKDLYEAIRLYEIASSQGIQDATLSLSYAYEELKMYDEAFNNASFYAEKDNFIGYLRLYELYAKGIGVNKNIEKSKEYLIIACDKRFNKAQSHISSLYSRGKGVPLNAKKALFWAEKAASNGSAEGATILGDYYLENKDINNALKWATIGANGDEVSAFRLLAKIYGKLKDKEKQIMYLKQASEKGDEKSMIKLAELYSKNENYEDSLIWFKKAAENMNAVGCFKYGYELFIGNHVNKNVEEGLKYLQLAADLNNVDALEKLVIIYKDGTQEIPKDDEKSSQYYQKLTELGESLKNKTKKKSSANNK